MLPRRGSDGKLKISSLASRLPHRSAQSYAELRCYVRAHARIAGNEAVDRLAKLAAQDEHFAEDAGCSVQVLQQAKEEYLRTKQGDPSIQPRPQPPPQPRDHPIRNFVNQYLLYHTSVSGEEPRVTAF